MTTRMRYPGFRTSFRRLYSVAGNRKSLNDLPPKDEAILRCDMSEDQADAYYSMKDLYLRQVTGLLTDEGLKGSRIEIFSILSKLRLLAIHPPMAGEPFADISSGKMSAMDNLMEEILEEDHKTLVFSQFLGALDRAEMTCRTRGWRYSRLTGSTKKSRGAHPTIHGRSGDKSLPSQSPCRRCRHQSHRGGLRHPSGSLVESGGGSPGRRSGAPHGTEEVGDGLQTHHVRHNRRKSPGTAGKKETSHHRSAG
jgi:hypothetical protein